MWNGYGFFFAYVVAPLIVIGAPVALYLRRRPMSWTLLFYAFVPVWPSRTLQYLFPGVHAPPDAAHHDVSATYVDRRPDPDPPTGTLRSEQLKAR